MQDFNNCLKELIKILGKNNVLTSKTDLLLNSYDASPIKAQPKAILNIYDTKQIPNILKVLNAFNIPCVVRMTGSNHDGACLALTGGIVLNLAPLDKILEINTKEHFAIVESGVINQDLQNALEPLGFFYAPDPASKNFSTIGGNVALNAGGPKSLKYGASAFNLLGAEVVLANGEILNLDSQNLSLLHLFTRSEGTLGIITKLKVKILPIPPYKETLLVEFSSLQDTMQVVQTIIAKGIVPSALEVLDETALKLADYKTCPKAVLIMELDGTKNDVKNTLQNVLEICKDNKPLNIKSNLTEEETQNIWAVRQKVVGSLASLAPCIISLDYAVPRNDLVKMITFTKEIFAKYNLRASVVFHAGDGNLHPNIVFEEKNFFEQNLIKKAIKELDNFVYSLHGTLSAEHGIAVQKRASMNLFLTKQTLSIFREIKNAFDPKNILNPDKVLPLCENAKIFEPDYTKTLLLEVEKQKKKSQITFDILKVLPPQIKVDLENCTLSVLANTPITDINKALKNTNLFLPTTQNKGTIGEVFLETKSLLGFVTSLDFICKEGTLLKLGNKAIKDACGYNLIDFLIGSLGAFGLPIKMNIHLLNYEPKKETFNKNKDFICTESLLKLKKIFDKNNYFNPKLFKSLLNEKN